MKKNIIIVVLGLLVLGLSGYLVYDKVLNKEEIKNESHEKGNKEDYLIDEEGKEQVSEKKEYIHFTKLEDAGLSYEVKDGKFLETSGKNFKISGIEGTVKYFTYDKSCEGDVEILVMTEDKKVYVSSFNLSDNDLNGKKLQFSQLKTDKKIVDITRYNNPTPVTCSGINVGVVVENDKIYSVIKKENTYTLDGHDYGQYQDTYGSLIIYSDNSVSTIGDVEYDKLYKLQYNGKTLTAKAIYKAPLSDGSIFYDKYYLVDNNNMLYLVELNIEDWQHDVRIKNVSLVKDVKVSSINKIDDSSISVVYSDKKTETLKVDIKDGHFLAKNL